jgi:hypothetical protein
MNYMGLSIPHLFTIQEIVHLKDIILHTFNETFTGPLYRTSMELFFIEFPSYLPPDPGLFDCLTTHS